MTPAYFDPNHFKRGQLVQYGEFEATIEGHYAEGLWNIRLPGGSACVSGANLKPVDPGHEEAVKLDYRLLGRLQADCEYYLGFGCRAAKHLWAGSEVEQIKKMKELYVSLPIKPDWLTLEKIEEYESAMVK